MDHQKIRIIQITDTHLFEATSGNLMGVRTRDTLSAVLELINQQYGDFECLLVTGDLTQDGSASSYEFLKTSLSALNKPFYWLCGNHDSPDVMADIAPEALVKRVCVGNWQVLMLNSQVLGSVHGHLSQSELDMLKSHLEQSPDLHTLVALHHHPETINSRWMDKIGLDNASELKEIIKPYQQVKAIIHGHAHQEGEFFLANSPVLATPSTCLQFTPKSDNFKVDRSLPGFRILDLLPDGRFETQVVRLEGFILEVDQTANGY